MGLNILEFGEGMPDKALTFGQHLQRWMDAKGNMSARKLAKAISRSPAYVGYLLKDNNPSTNKPIQIKGPLANKIADALDRTRNEVREAAGLSSEKTAQRIDENAERLLQFFADLPMESKLDLLAAAEAIWKRRRPGSNNHLAPVSNEDAA